MGSDVNERAAALFGFIREHTPGRHTPAAQRMGLGEIDLPQLTLLAETLSKSGYPHGNGSDSR